MAYAEKVGTYWRGRYRLANGRTATVKDSAGRVVHFRCDIEFGNKCRVAAGDLIVGDIDGVLVVPKGSVQDVLEAALAKVAGEDNVRRSILQGERTEDIFRRTGIM